MTSPPAIDKLVHQRYRFDVVVDSEGGYVIEYPDLSSCMTRVETIEEVGPAAREIFELWMEAAIVSGIAIAPPSGPEQYSGKFLVRLPKSLHRRLAVRARDDGASLNQLVTALLAEGVGRFREGVAAQSLDNPLNAESSRLLLKTGSSSVYAVAEVPESYDLEPGSTEAGPATPPGKSSMTRPGSVEAIATEPSVSARPSKDIQQQPEIRKGN